MGIQSLPSHYVWSREVQKNVMGKAKEKSGTEGDLGLSYKSRVPVPFFNLPKVQKFRPKGPKEPQDYDYANNIEYGMVRS